MPVNVLPDSEIELLEHTLERLDAMIAHATHLRVQVIELLCETQQPDPATCKHDDEVWFGNVTHIWFCTVCGADLPGYRPADAAPHLFAPLGAPIRARSVR